MNKWDLGHHDIECHIPANIPFGIREIMGKTHGLISYTISFHLPHWASELA